MASLFLEETKFGLGWVLQEPDARMELEAQEIYWR